MRSGTRLTAVDVEDLAAVSEPLPPAPSPATPPLHAALAGLFALSIKTLSQRALVAVASLVDLALIASAFVLWRNIIAQPTVLQLVGAGMYAVFVLIVLWIRHAR